MSFYVTMLRTKKQWVSSCTWPLPHPEKMHLVMYRTWIYPKTRTLSPHWLSANCVTRQRDRTRPTCIRVQNEAYTYIPHYPLIKPPEPHTGDVSTFLLCLTNSSTFPPPHTRRVPLTASMAELSILCGQVLFQNNCAGRDQSHRGSTGMDSYRQSVTLHAGAYPQTYMSTCTQGIIPHFLLPEPVGKRHCLTAQQDKKHLLFYSCIASSTTWSWTTPEAPGSWK